MNSTVATKRNSQDDAEYHAIMPSKRQKIIESDDMHTMGRNIGATELASAFALASLASMKPSQVPKMHVVEESPIQDESRDAEHGEEFTQVSPDVRSPVRSSTSKQVTFAEDTKDIHRVASRKLSLPRRINHTARPPFVRGHSYPGRVPENWLRPRGMGPPPMMPPVNDKWICDFCNIASFDTYQEACVHEESCRVRCSMPPHRPGVWRPGMAAPPPPPQMFRHRMPPPPMFHPHIMQEHPLHGIRAGPQAWFKGTTSLAIPGSDPDWLSSVNCFVRECCVEAFSATEEDVNKSSKRGKISLHQVGIRCRFCSHRAKEEIQAAAVSYPTSVSGIYESVKRWQKVHLELCQDIPEDVKTKLAELGSSSSWVPTTRQYWADSARSMGMVDTHDGIRFSADPKKTPVCFGPDYQQMQESSDRESPVEGSEDMEKRESPALVDGDNIVQPEDMTMVPPYVYFLMRQVEATHFTEADRFVARSKGPVGYSGFQCRHCHGHAGLGKYFPVSSKSLSTNSTSQNIHSHLLKCRKASPYVKEQLVSLKEEKSKAPRLEPGWRRVFFDKIWVRLHGKSP